MLSFIKTHQRKFFIVISVVMVFSFVFFGTFSTLMQQQPEIPDREIAKGITGKSIMKKEIDALRHMIATSYLEAGLDRPGNIPNLLNDGILEREFLHNGVAELLVERYFEQLKPELDFRLKKMKNFRPYVHPAGPQINAMSIYQRFAPGLAAQIEGIKKQGDSCTLATFRMMVKLYLDQGSLPPEMLRQILMLQQDQQGMPKDPQIARGDFSLFGFTSLEDWFGPLFVELNAQLIANVAALAETKGYKVKTDEVRSDLFHNIYAGHKRMTRKNMSAQEADQYYRKKTQHLGIDEATLVETWRKVLLCRRLFTDVSGSVLIDSLPYRQFQEYSKQHAKIELYELANNLELNDFQTMLKFQIYLEGIALDGAQVRSQLILPRQVASLEQIRKRQPDLVQREYEVEYAAVVKSQLACEISLKETWDWEVQDAHWELLQNEFSQLKEIVATTDSLRLNALDALDKKMRIAVDAFARGKMIDAMPQKIINELELAPLKTAKISLRPKAGHMPFNGVQDRSRLISLLEKAVVSEELAENDPLNCFTTDNDHFYRIKVLSKETTPRVLSFKEALADGTLDLMLNQRLEDAYPEVRKKNSSYFQLAKGGWKPLKEVKDQVGRYVFSDLLKNIEEGYKSMVGALPGNPGEMPLVFYSNYRLFFYMQDAQKHIQRNPLDPAWVSVGEGNSSRLEQQWLLTRSERTVQRSENLKYAKEDMFTLPLQGWSDLKLGTGGALAFYKVVERGADVEISHEQIEEGHELLSLDARKQLMRELLTMIDQKKAIDISKARFGEGDER